MHLKGLKKKKKADLHPLAQGAVFQQTEFILEAGHLGAAGLWGGVTLGSLFFAASQVSPNHVMGR